MKGIGCTLGLLAVFSMIALLGVAKDYRVTEAELSPVEAVREHYPDVREIVPLANPTRWNPEFTILVARHTDGSVWEYRHRRIRTGQNRAPIWWDRIQARMLFPPNVGAQASSEAG